MDIRAATREASLLRLRPIMMTALVACLGLLPAALSTGIGSDAQKPFAIVIVAGLVSRLFLGFFVNPVLCQMVARDGDVLQVCFGQPACGRARPSCGSLGVGASRPPRRAGAVRGRCPQGPAGGTPNVT